MQPNPIKTKKHYYKVEDIKTAMRGREVEVLENVANIAADFLDGRHHGCPKCGEGKDRFRLINRARGAVFCNQCLHEKNGDAISAVMHFRGVSMPDALRLIGEYLGIEPARSNRKNPNSTTNNLGELTRATRPSRTTSEVNEESYIMQTAESGSNVDEKKAESQQDDRSRHEVYSLVLSALELSSEHSQALRQRGLSDAEIKIGQYRSVTRSSKLGQVLKEWIDDAPSTRLELALTVPGIVRDDGESVKFASPCGLLIPVRNAGGNIQALRIRPDTSRGGKYRWITSRSSTFPDLPSPGSPCHIPFGITGPIDDLRITEGELKADIAFHLSGVPTISIPGVNSWKTVLPIIQMMKPKRVLIGLDADFRTNSHVATALQELVTAISSACTVAVEVWSPDDGKGIDDLLASGCVPTHVQGDELQAMLAELPMLARNCRPTTSRTQIIVDTDEHRVNDAAIAAIAGDEELFVRAGILTRIVDTDTVLDGIVRPNGGRRMSEMAPQSLRESMTRSIEFIVQRINPQGDIVTKPIHPPGWCVSAVHARGYWPGIRPLRSIVACPVLRPDGSIMSANGYDPSTGLFLASSINLPPIPARPTRDDAIRACNVLLDVVADFPFAKPEHRAGWLAFVLTLLSRHAFSGPSPLFLVDANTRGSGKSLLVDAAGIIAMGVTVPRMSNPKDDEECRKRITALALAGDQMVLIDNIIGNLGCASLDAAITTPDSWKDRILGRSEMTNLPLSFVWSATGNNIALEADTSRRSMHIRLESSLENPELRSGFKHPNLIAYAKRERAGLVAAGLTILSAYFVAGRPRMNLPAWGSFEAWSSIVREAIAWCGLPDPGRTREELATRSDVVAGVLQSLVNHWPTIDPHCKGLTSTELLRTMAAGLPEHDSIREAVCELCEIVGDRLPTSRSLGNRFKQVSGRVINGMVLKSIPEHGTARWIVRPISKLANGCSGGSGWSTLTA